MTRPKPFLFTRWLFSPELLHPWLAHFSHHNTPAGIVSRKRGPAHFAVWRYGVEVTGEKTFKSECVSEDMRVEKSINGFEEKFNAYKEEVLNGGRNSSKRKARQEGTVIRGRKDLPTVHGVR